MAVFEREYGVATNFQAPVVLVADDTFAGSGDITWAAGDVKISKDGAAAANITTLPTIVSGIDLWDFSLSATEMQAKQITVWIKDATGELVYEDAFIINTTGDSSAQHVTPRDVDLLTEAEVQRSAGLILSTTVATVNSQTEFVLTDGAATDDMYNKAQNGLCLIGDVSDSGHKTFGFVSDYVGGNKTVTITEAPAFTVVAGDTFDILAPTVTVDVSSLATAASITTLQSDVTDLGTNKATPAQVNTEVLDVLNTDTFTELTTDPGASPTLTQMIRYLYMQTRNRRTTTTSGGSGTIKVYLNDGTTEWITCTYSDDDTTADKGAFS
jgi:hypothetical protein